MPNCCIVGCGNRKSKDRPNLSLHRLPSNDFKRKVWLDSIGEQNLRTDTKTIFICSLHFKESSFNHTNNCTVLLDDAVPSQNFLPKPAQLVSRETIDTSQEEEYYTPSKLPSQLEISMGRHPAQPRQALLVFKEEIGTSQRKQDCTPSKLLSQVENRMDGVPAQETTLLTQKIQSDIKNQNLAMKIIEIRKQNKRLKRIIRGHKNKIESLQEMLPGNNQQVSSETIGISELEEVCTSSKLPSQEMRMDEDPTELTSKDMSPDVSKTSSKSTLKFTQTSQATNVALEQETTLLSQKLESDIKNQTLNLKIKEALNLNKSLKRNAERHKNKVRSLQEIIIKNNRNIVRNREQCLSEKCDGSQDILKRQIKKRRINKAQDCAKDGTTKGNLSQLQQSVKPCEVAEYDHDAGDIQSDDGDKETGHQFSWQKSSQICIDDDDDIFDEEVPHVPALDIEVEQAEEKPKDTISEDHKEYFCDSCTNSIVGPRYRCVECDNFDLCSRCEARHARHYMLRIPRPRPFSEIKIIIDAIREKLKGFSEEIPQNSLELDEIKQEPDFIEPAALDPLSLRPHADEAADTSQCVPQSPPPITQRSETTIRKMAPDDNLSKTERRKVTAVDNVTVTSLSDVTYKAPRVTSLATNNRPIYVISHNATQKRPKVTQLKGTFKNVQTAPAVVDPKVTLKQVDLIKDNEKPHKDGNTSKQMLATFVEKSFKRNQVFKDMEETLKHCFANISDGGTRGKGFKRKNSDLEETWLDEELLAEDIDSSEEDCEETPATRVTRSATKSKQLSDENAPDT